MNNLDLLKKQHIEIHRLIQSINTLLAVNPTSNGGKLALQINTMSGKLKMHLLSEDQYLYPALMHSPQQQVRETANRFHVEMGGLAQQFQMFIQQYNTTNKIAQRQSQFLVDCKRMFTQIEKRITREDQVLYPLAEKM